MVRGTRKGPSVDPQLGDLQAEPGSREWALGVRASIWGKERELGASVGDVALRLDRLLTTGAWAHLFRADGSAFGSIEEYIAYRPPYGMGVPLDMMRHYLGLTHEGKAIRAHLAVKASPTHRVPLADIDRGGGTQVRESMAAATVDEYAAAITDGAAFPPVVVFFDGETHWLADGFHRVAAHEKAGVPDVLAEVREGTREDALWFALSANKRHGLPMGPEDKRRAVRLLLGVEKWAGMSNVAIAKELGISDHTVASVKQEMGCSTSQNARLSTPKTKGIDGKARSSPGASSDKVRDFLAGTDHVKMSNRAIAEALDVAQGTVAKVRKQMAATPAEDALSSSTDATTTPAEEKPAPPARHPALVAIDEAADLAALNRAMTAARDDATLSDKEAVGAAYRKRGAALREQSTTTPAAPAPVSTQAPSSQPGQATPREQGDLFTGLASSMVRDDELDALDLADQIREIVARLVRDGRPVPRALTSDLAAMIEMWGDQ